MRCKVTIAALEEARFWQFSGNSILPFGKHKGMTINQLFVDEPGYLAWCSNNIDSFVLSEKFWSQHISFIGSKAKMNSPLVNVNGRLPTGWLNILNKWHELERIIRENAGFVTRKGDYMGEYGENRIGESLIQKILILEADQCFFLKSDLRQSLTADNGQKLEKFCPCLEIGSATSYSDSVSNKVVLSVKFVDYQDIATFRKYEFAYASPHIQTFEIIKQSGEGSLTVMVVTMDWSHTQRGSHECEKYKHVTPEDATCVEFIINEYFTKEVFVGTRIMTDEEVAMVVAKQQTRYESALERHNKERQKFDTQKMSLSTKQQKLFESRLLDETFDVEFCDPKYDDFTIFPDDGPFYRNGNIFFENGRHCGTISIMQIQNTLVNILHEYETTRSYFPDLNVFGNTQLADKAKKLIFELDYVKLVEDTRVWYKANGKEKLYDKLSLRMWQAYCRQERQEPNYFDSDSNYDKDAFDAMTDGQEGFWEDL